MQKFDEKAKLEKMIAIKTDFIISLLKKHDEVYLEAIKSRKEDLGTIQKHEKRFPY